MIKVGDQLSEVTFLDHKGNVESLNGNQGKVIFCYPKASTPG